MLYPVQTLLKLRMDLFLLGLVLSSTLLAPPRDSDWYSNSEIHSARVFSDPSLGQAQGGTYHDGHVYLYGDVDTVQPRVGLIREYTPGLKPTGRQILLNQKGVPVARHPTGLTFHPKYGAVLGNTEDKIGTILMLDWERALKDGNLDHALRKKVTDVEARNGTRPIFIKIAGTTYLASADYGNNLPELRLYDPAILFGSKSKRSSIVRRIDTNAFNQNIDFDPNTERLTLIQNVVEGLGWRLTTVDANQLLNQSVKHTDSALVERRTFLPHTELEGYFRLPKGEAVFITSDTTDNIIVGKPTFTKTNTLSQAGESRISKRKNPKSTQIPNCFTSLPKLVSK